MTEQQAIKAIQNDLEWHSKELKPAYKEVLKMAIQALEEIQQYRAIGTVEQLNTLQQDYWKLNEMCKEYSAIGTIEEFKALKEKADLYEQAFYLLLKDDCKRLPEGWTGSIDELYVGRKQFYLDKVEKAKVLGKIKI